MSAEPSSSSSDWIRQLDYFGAIPRRRFLWRQVDWRRAARTALLTVATLYLAATAVRIYARKYYIFIPDYVRWTLNHWGTPVSASAGPTHVFLVFVDHFEPDWDASRAREWAQRYMSFASRHHDSTGRPLQHTWFYPGEQVDDDIMGTLRTLTEGGFGEVELHFHHGYDTEATLRPALESSIGDFQRFGFLETRDGATHFAFIHGNSGLDNSNGPELCGVSREIAMLRDLGCFADFTFPSLYEDSQPSVVNRIYAAKDDDRPKSYDTALPIADLDRGRADLLIFQGPLVFAPTLNLGRLFLDLDDGNIHAGMPASPARVERWLHADVHVPERPDWVFIKLFTHGASSASDEDAVMGQDFDGALTYLEQHYNDGRRYILHYITAREASNLARAAAQGRTGDPQQYLDWMIPPYVADGPRTPYR